MKSLRFLIPLGLFAVLVAFLAVGLKLDPREVPSPLIGKPAPKFALPLLANANQTMRREDMLGKVWILNVWASWCVACRDEHPLLVEYSRAKRVPIYGLNYKDTREAGQQWLTRFGNPYDASLFDQDGRVGIEWGVYGVPETFIVDREGTIRFKHIGALTPAILRERIEPLLKQLNG